MASIPIGSQAFTTVVDPISPPSATAEIRDPSLVVEAPGYCPPGPICLFRQALYRHSRLPGPSYVGRVRFEDKGAKSGFASGTFALGNPLSLSVRDLRKGGTRDFERRETFRGIHMKKLAFAITGATAMALAACSPADDQEDMVEEQNDAQMEQMEEQADMLEDQGMEAEADAVEEQMEVADEQGEMREEAAEDADGDVL